MTAATTSARMPRQLRADGTSDALPSHHSPRAAATDSVVLEALAASVNVALSSCQPAAATGSGGKARVQSTSPDADLSDATTRVPSPPPSTAAGSAVGPRSTSRSAYAAPPSISSDEPYDMPASKPSKKPPCETPHGLLAPPPAPAAGEVDAVEPLVAGEELAAAGQCTECPRSPVTSDELAAQYGAASAAAPMAAQRGAPPTPAAAICRTCAGHLSSGGDGTANLRFASISAAKPSYRSCRVNSRSWP